VSRDGTAPARPCRLQRARLWARRDVSRGRRNAAREGDRYERKAGPGDAVAASLQAVTALAGSLEGEAADIIGFQVALLEDDALTESAYAAIDRDMPADMAWQQAMAEEIAGYEISDDLYFRARSADLADICDRVLRHLFGLPELTQAPAGAVIVGEDLPPSAFLGIDWSQGGGIVLGSGSPSSHVAMLARGRGVPMVVGIGAEWQAVSGTVIVDGLAGLVLTGPSRCEHRAGKTAGGRTRPLAEQSGGPQGRACADPRRNPHRRDGQCRRHGRSRRSGSRGLRWHRPDTHRVPRRTRTA
jgi:phosphotransferase system enzyme I (PtsI)